MRSFGKQMWLVWFFVIAWAASAPASAGENLLKGGDAENPQEVQGWQALKAEVYTADKHAGNASYKRGPGYYTCYGDPIPVDLGKAYRLAGFFKGLDPVKPNRLTFGLRLLDQDKRELSSVFFNVMHQTEAELVEPAAQGTKTLFVSSAASRWGIYRSIAFDAKDDYSDLPNRTCSPLINKLEARGDRYEVTLGGPLGAAYPAGTKLRLHAGGSPYQGYAAADVFCPQEWTEYSAVISGVAPILTDANRLKFLPGTRFVQVFLTNLTEVLFDDLSFAEVEGVTPPPPVEVYCPPQLLLRATRPEALYQCGEEASFTFRLKQKGQIVKTGQPVAILYGAGGKELRRETLDLSQGEATISGTLTEPGFLTCVVQVSLDGKTFEDRAAAGFEPERIQPAAACPDDFMEFWQRSFDEIQQIPPDVQLTRLPDFSTDRYDSYKISVANLGGTRTYGFLSVPKQGPCPAIVSVPGAGSGVTTPPTYWAQRGAISLVVNVFHTELPAESAARAAAYRELNKEKWYFLQGLESRETYYYRKSILGVRRLIEYLRQRPDWNQRQLVMYGASQGGGFSLILSGLVPEITAMSASLPALCDWGAGPLAGWPQPGSDVEAARYYDAVNFARRVRCPALVSVGFIDLLCKPSSVYAAYNQLQGPKLIMNGPLTGHGSGEPMTAFDNYRDNWLAGQLGLADKTPPGD